MAKVNIQRLSTVEAATQQWSTGDTYFDTTLGLQLTYNGSGWVDTITNMLISGTNIKTINGSSILSSGNLEISNASDYSNTFLLMGS